MQYLSQPCIAVSHDSHTATNADPSWRVSYLPLILLIALAAKFPPVPLTRNRSGNVLISLAGQHEYSDNNGTV